ncbi:MAG: M15 family metallopeptidase [Muribaculaceae bacterium]|nr:M15 family metallopeptidase [Muribaculaceae bacterium]
MKGTFIKDSIPDKIFSLMEGKSFKRNNYISRNDLSYLVVSHYDFNHKACIGEIVCNKLIADSILNVLSELFASEYEIDKFRLIDYYNADDNLSMADNNSSSFNFREIAGSDKLSQHAYGLAIDINPLYNPYVKSANQHQIIMPSEATPYVDRSVDFPHKLWENDICVQTFKKNGFTWGGDWTHAKDYQHFEKTFAK